eukprot:2212800-Lingulodinium_polyedra.AAC.1
MSRWHALACLRRGGAAAETDYAQPDAKQHHSSQARGAAHGTTGNTGMGHSGTTRVPVPSPLHGGRTTQRAGCKP